MKRERKRDAVWFGAAFGLVLLVVLAFSMARLFAGGRGEQASLPQELGLDETLGKTAAFWDGHGGFHGDGTAYWEIAFSPEEAALLEAALPVKEGWRPLPVDGDAQALLYGTEQREGDAVYAAGPYLTGQDGQALLPPVEEGCWFFYNKQTGRYDDAGVLNQPSQNFIAAVYDSRTHTLYCGELDT